MKMSVVSAHQLNYVVRNMHRFDYRVAKIAVPSVQVAWITGTTLFIPRRPYGKR